MTTPNYIVTPVVIETYSKILEPVCNQLQAVSMNLKVLHEHVNKLISVFEAHQNSPRFSERKAKYIYERLDIEIELSQIVARQVHKPNPMCENDEDFFRITIFIPYLDSPISSLRDRFSQLNEKALSLM